MDNKNIQKINIETVAEQWVNLVLAHIEARKQENHASANKKAGREL